MEANLDTYAVLSLTIDATEKTEFFGVVESSEHILRQINRWKSLRGLTMLTKLNPRTYVHQFSSKSVTCLSPDSTYKHFSEMTEDKTRRALTC